MLALKKTGPIRGDMVIIIMLALLVLLSLAIFIGVPLIQYKVITETLAREEVPVIKVLGSLDDAKPGDTAIFSIFIDTAGASIVGADVELVYDPQSLTVEESGVAPGNIFPQYRGGLAGSRFIHQEDGRVSISGFVAPESPTPSVFTGKAGLFATLTATTRMPGTITVVFAQDSTDDSNLIELTTGKDILAGVKNATIAMPSITPFPPLPLLASGDYNDDGVVNTLDFSILYSNWGHDPDPRVDLNGDRQVNTADYALLLRLIRPSPTPQQE